MALGLWPTCTYTHTHTRGLTDTHTNMHTHTREQRATPMPRVLPFNTECCHKKQRQVFNFVARSWQTEKYKQKTLLSYHRVGVEGNGGWAWGVQGEVEDSSQHINKMKNLLPAKCSWVQKAGSCTWQQSRHLVTSRCSVPHLVESSPMYLLSTMLYGIRHIM